MISGQLYFISTIQFSGSLQLHGFFTKFAKEELVPIEGDVLDTLIL